MKKIKQQQTLLKQSIVAGSICLGMIIAQFFLWDFVQQSADALHTKQTEQQQLEQLQARVQDIQTKYQASQPLVDQLSVPFPKAASTPQVVDRLEQVANREGVAMSLTNITSQAPAAKGNNQLTTVTITLRVDGRAHALLEYVEALEHIQEVTTIQQWNINPQPVITGTTLLPGQTPAPLQYTMNMNVLFYLQP